MNARLTEHCRSNPLDLLGPEQRVELDSVYEGRGQNDLLLRCDKDIYIGVFFDGTNNNKFRDTPGYSQSNVARLYEVYPGTPAAQKPPNLLPRVLPDGATAARPVFPDVAFRSSSVSAADLPYYRKVYVPGLGTPMPDVGDKGTGLDRTGGLVAAYRGQARLEWASLQLLSQIHAAVFKTPLEAGVDIKDRWIGVLQDLARLHPVTGMGLLLIGAMPNSSGGTAPDIRPPGLIDRLGLDEKLVDYEKRLAAALKQRGDNKPTLRKIRLSVFGFSRGAAAARAWVNLVTRRWGSSIAGLRLQIDFLGIFDTVASVGFAQAMPGFEGHADWASEPYMQVPADVRRCAHLVAALEVRGSFPLDSVCQGNILPSNCKEIVYPGVHSDVGGGYAPDDQGRALGLGAAGDRFKISQISLAQMYREARMAGVPLAPESAMLDPQKLSFAIAPQLRDDFNAYVAATRNGSVPPTQGKGEATFARMYPTETQPREELFRIIRRHYGIMLRWRKATMFRKGGIAALAGPMQARSESRFQDREDLRGAEAELAAEVVYLQSPDRSKRGNLDDPLQAALTNLANGAAATAAPVVSSASKLLRNLQTVLLDKQRQWDTWLQHEWASHGPQALPSAAEVLFERYVHDSRAWFKPMLTSDTHRLAPNDEDWFIFGQRDRQRESRRQSLRNSIARDLRSGDEKAARAANEQLQELDKEGQPLIKGGREPYRMWGYLRHRMIYQSGKLSDQNWASRQEIVDAEERQRMSRQQREDKIAAENALHGAEVSKIRAYNEQVVRSGRLEGSALREFNDATEAQLQREKLRHERALALIDNATTAA